MLENQESLLPLPPSGKKLRAMSVGSDKETLDELERLLTTLGVEPAERMLFALRKINPATYIGEGKVDEIKEKLQEIDTVILDAELSPNQLKNLEKTFGKPVLDRPGVIIEIFSRHARSKEAKTQVELARLQYLLPRLTHFWTHFERQRGGIGMKGMGEKQIEVDRRLVKKRMGILRDRLSSISNERTIQRAGRKDLLKVALVGYTNAGKSTLLNALTHSSVRAENKLFATLDPSVRLLNPDTHPPIVMIDTVGFIDKLPHSLVASFRSTLEELHQADLLVHVVDASSEHARKQVEVTEEVLGDLGVDKKPKVMVLNKVDLLKSHAERNRARLASPGAIPVSSFNEEDVKKLRGLIEEHFRSGFELWEIVLPYSESKLEAQLHEYGSIETSRHLEKGTFFRIRLPTHWAKKLNLARFRT